MIYKRLYVHFDKWLVAPQWDGLLLFAPQQEIRDLADKRFHSIIRGWA